jgi:PAS domain S-box-containing protein
MILSGVDRTALGRGVQRVTGSRSPAALIVAGAMFAVVLALRLIITTPGIGITLLYDVPVALVAITYGSRAGLIAAAVAFGLYAFGENVAAITVGGMTVGPKWEAYVFRGITFFMVGGLVGLFSDHTRAVERRFREVIESAPDATVIVNEDDEVLLANLQAQRLFGETRDGLLGRRVETLMPERFRSDHTSNRRRYLDDPGPRTLGPGGEIYALRRDGREVPVEISLSPLHPEGGGILISAAIRDITERKQAEADLKQARDELQERNVDLERSNSDLAQFAHIASHDLQEPLRVIGGFVQLLARRYEGQLDEDADKFIAATVSGVDRMQQLIDALLSYSRVGNADAVREPVDTAALVRRVTESMEEELERTHSTIEANGLPTVDAVPLLLEQLLRNLISNALKFSDADAPRVEVEASREDGIWIFSVKDNGPGIDPRYRERVFAIFNRLHGRDVAGTGIGLAICRRIAERHGGRIWVEAARDGGSDFKFTLTADSATGEDSP